MAGGITSTLNIAKQAILAQQAAIQVTGHNVANVDTEGYSRQEVKVSPGTSYPGGFGMLGSGIKADSVARHYDKLAVQRMMSEASIMGDLSAQTEALRLVEATFNETSGLALNDLMSQFWQSWQDLASNPEMVSARQTVVQQASLVANQLQQVSSELLRSRIDLGVNLDSGVGSVNDLTRQIAKLNTEITSIESANYQANDLRDQRDNLLMDLSEMVDVSYFETSAGAYTIMLPDGHTLVEDEKSWQLSWDSGPISWVTTRVTESNEKVDVLVELGDPTILGGKLGGWKQMYDKLDATDPTSYAGKLKAFAYSFIREVNQQHSQGAGLERFSGNVVGTETANNMAVLTSIVASATATDIVDAGTIVINGREVGVINGSVAVNGRAVGKAYNAVTAINDAITGVTARLTTQVAGNAVTAMAGGDVGSALSFTVNGITINYTVQAGDTTAATLASNVVAAINTAISNYNAVAANGPDMTIEAVVGDGANGGAISSIMLRNTNPGDDSEIVLAGLATTGAEANLGLENDTFVADDIYNTGEITLFSGDPFTVRAGPNDLTLAHFNWDGGSISESDEGGDGTFTYSYDDGGAAAGLMGYEYGSELVRDGGSFKIWLYNTDGTLALPQPVTVSMQRAYTLENVASAINDAIATAGGSASWLTASVDVSNRLALRGGVNHEFAFADDTSNILQVAGINTLFSGYDAGSIDVNSMVADNLSFVAAGAVDSYGDMFGGNNSNALAMTEVRENENVSFTGGNEATLDNFYNALIGDIGMRGLSAKREFSFHEVLSSQISAMRDAVSAVSLDEEMTNLIKFQQAYTAAAKLITMSDEMMQTLLDTV